MRVNERLVPCGNCSCAAYALLLTMLVCAADCRALSLFPADLSVQQMTQDPVSPAPGATVKFTVTIKNQGLSSTSAPFSVGFWSNLPAAPTASSVPEQTLQTPALNAGASVQLTFSVTAPAAGTYAAWAYVDQAGAISDSNKNNNVGPLPAGHAWTVTAPPPPTGSGGGSGGSGGSGSSGSSGSGGSSGSSGSSGSGTGGSSSSGTLSFTSPPVSAPNPAAIGDTVTFTVGAVSSSGASLSYTWDFGDGSSDVGASTTHAYATAGVFTAVLTVSDGTQVISGTLAVAINAAPSSGSAPSPNSFVVKKAALKINVKASGKDMLTLSGMLPVQNFAPVGKVVTVVIGKMNADYMLNSKAAGGDKNSGFKLAGKLSKGIYATPTVKFQISLKNQDLSAPLTNFTFPGEKNNSIVNLPVVISTAASVWEVDVVHFSYNTKTGVGTQIGTR